MIQEETARPGRGIFAGVVAGVVGLGCCVGPAVAALTGITSAAVAIDAANSLYAEWGWAFKVAGVIAGAAAIGLSLRARLRCRSRPLGIGRYALIVIVTGLVTYGVLYGLTTWLGGLGDEGAAAAAEQRLSPHSSVEVSGRSVSSRVNSALKEITSRYPTVELSFVGASRDSILVKTGWELPDTPVGERYYTELQDTIEDSREATILLLQTIARTNPGIDHLGAYEDRNIVPIWSREQVLAAGDPRNFRDFERFTSFQVDAERQTGYFAILTGGTDR
ncbi:MAG: hypothetical protein ACRDK3_04555 [Actinomycetota bacterium]